MWFEAPWLERDQERPLHGTMWYEAPEFECDSERPHHGTSIAGVGGTLGREGQRKDHHICARAKVDEGTPGTACAAQGTI